jgi:hypothetical protein
MQETQGIADTLEIALARARELVDGAGLVGYGVVEVRGADGVLKQVEPFANIVTTAGDQWYAQAAAAAAGGAAASPIKPNGMRLGTATTAAAKSGVGAASIASGSYITGSNNLFDSVPTAAAAVGTDQGWEVSYVTTWAAGDSTNPTINEVSLVNDAGTDTGAASAAVANTYARAVVAAINKGASDSVTITWKHKFLGA